MNDIFNRKSNRGIRISFLNTFIIVTSCFLCIGLLAATSVVLARYENLMTSTRNYIIAEEKADMVTTASDYLTEQVRLYAQNNNVKHMEAYFEEANVTKRREKALADLDMLHTDDELSKSLEKSVQLSKDLMKREYYSMKLVSTAKGYDMNLIPIEVAETLLTPEDMQLTPQQMIDKARQIVFDDEYEQAKHDIEKNAALFTNEIVALQEECQVSSADDLYNAISAQRVFTIVMLVLNLLSFYTFSKFVVGPLKLFMKCIRNRSLLEYTEVYEYNCLVGVYNNIYKQNMNNAANASSLKYKAEHDVLTGALNRASFEQISGMLKSMDMPVGLLLMDVDDFKYINDTYGHVVGDQVLKNVVSVLESNFRSRGDYLFRIGGDEFANILLNFDESQSAAVEKKIMEINRILKDISGDLPGVSLSVGVAFSSGGYNDALYEKADRALYMAKEQGKCRCCFYDMSM
ncbi:MAG: GGDEF domain-containing protein [Oscillospiraceae bacterium]|nr:GGDEF domain-containing protein [Oscillospiraceae bacterium]